MIINSCRQILFITALLCFSAYNLFADEACPFKDLALKKLSLVRELNATKEVPCKSLKKEEIRNYIISALDKKVSPEKIKLEEGVLKALKLIPSSYNYKEELLKLYTNQVGGFYDPEEEYFATASWIPQNMQLPINFHELTHALQDQHFNLDSYTDNNLSSDELLARSAVAEGDASLSMLLVAKDSQENKPNISALEIRTFSEGTTKSALENTALKTSPQAIRALLIFPYSKGTEYIFKAYKSGGWKAVDNKYKSPPTGTNEILGLSTEILEDTQKQALDCSKIDPSAEVIYEDTLGALYLNYVLGNDPLLEKPIDVWAGDRVCVIKKNSASVLYWTIVLKKEATEAMSKLKNDLGFKFQEFDENTIRLERVNTDAKPPRSQNSSHTIQSSP